MDMKINKETLRRERELRAWTQSHLAEVADLSMRTVQRIERTGDVSMESASALAAALDLDVAALLAGAPEQIASSAPIKHRRYQLWGAVGCLASVLIGLGWWSTAAADQVMISLLVSTESGARTHGDMQFISEPGAQNEIQFDQQFRLLVSTAREPQGLLISTQVYDYIDGDYRLVSSPAILVADKQLSAIHVSTKSSGRLELAFSSDF